MARVSRIHQAKPTIEKFFEAAPTKIFRSPDLARVFSTHREDWKLPKSFTTGAFVEFLIRETKLRRLDFPFPHRSEHRYVWGEVPLLNVLQDTKPGSYFSHYTAMRMHGLTEQIPKTIYLNHEQPPHVQRRDLTQQRIDAAFARRPRVSNNVINFENARITLINGMHTGQLGVETKTVYYDSTTPLTVRVTGLERTLIDIAVRPIYAGGIPEVQKAYEVAKSEVSVPKLAAILKELNYVYPYHQAIGFYMDRAKYSESDLQVIKQFPMEFDFYLTNQMREKDLDPTWRLFIPQGF